MRQTFSMCLTVQLSKEIRYKIDTFGCKKISFRGEGTAKTVDVFLTR